LKLEKADQVPEKGYELPKSPVQQNLDAVWMPADRIYMQRALTLAERAEAEGEIPVGAVLVQGETAIGEGWNRPISTFDPTAHAEIVALREVARVERLVFAARDLRFGGVRSKFRLADSDLLNHQVRVEEGLLAVEAAEMLRRFFEERR
jgi:tRNA(adenine34) deaminase